MQMNGKHVKMRDLGDGMEAGSLSLLDLPLSTAVATVAVQLG